MLAVVTLLCCHLEDKMSLRFPTSSTIAVTGANGYIGSHIVKALLAEGFKVRAVVRDPNNPKKVGHLQAFPGAAEVRSLPPYFIVFYIM